jgi:hypothetical protein
MRWVWIIGLLSFSAIAPIEAADQAVPGVAISSSIVDFNDLDVPVQMLEQEFDPSLLDNLVPISTATAQIRLPTTVMKSDQWQGSQCGIGKPVHVVFRKSEEWDKFWTSAIQPYISGSPKTPPIDFSKDMVIGVFRGDDARPGDLIQIEGVKPDVGGPEPQLIVTYRNYSKMQPVFVPPFAVQPFHLKKVLAFPGRVVFRPVLNKS